MTTKIRGISAAHAQSQHQRHEFISAIIENRQPAVNIWEAIAFTLPGIVAEQSAFRGTKRRKVSDCQHIS